jgi:hypothetical protein
MKLADRIILHLLKHGRKDPGEIMIPNFYHHGYEMDVFKLTKKQLVVEYEVKISRADFFNDFKKFHTDYGLFDEVKLEFMEKRDLYKHDLLVAGRAASSFFFVVPEGLVSKNEVPKHCGLMYFQLSGTMQPEGYLSDFDKLYTERPAPILHKRQFTDYQQLAKSLSWREDRWRRKSYKNDN